ncbi:MAG: SpoIIE family protein phosphatase [Phycisphaerales bacterium]
MSEASRPTNPFANAADTDQAYRDAVETRRATSLRRRVMWCCILGMFFVLIGVLGHGMELLGLRMEAGAKASEEAALAAELAAHGGAATTAPAPRWTGLFPSTITHFTSTTLVLGLCTWVLIYTARTRPLSETEAARAGPNINSGRKRLVFALTTLALGEILILVPAEIIAQNLDFYHGPLDAVQKVNEEPDRAGYTAANAYGMFYLLACVFVPMRWKESLRIALPGLAVLTGSVMFLPVLGWQPIVGFLLLALAYTVISAGWSAWRYADFDARLRAHGLGARYADLSEQVSSISAELQEARRLHESLFPALAVLQGHPDTPVRVGFRYEPARQIGGDFLDVYREPPATAADPTADKGGGVTVVVIDVSGHGVTAALAVNRLHGELRRFFARYPRRADDRRSVAVLRRPRPPAVGAQHLHLRSARRARRVRHCDRRARCAAGRRQRAGPLGQRRPPNRLPRSADRRSRRSGIDRHHARRPPARSVRSPRALSRDARRLAPCHLHRRRSRVPRRPRPGLHRRTPPRTHRRAGERRYPGVARPAHGLRPLPPARPNHRRHPAGRPPDRSTSRLSPPRRGTRPLKIDHKYP